MKLIIAGGKDYTLTATDLAKLAALKPDVTEVVSGRFPGEESWGEQWAEENGIPIKQFPADWDVIAIPGAFVKRRKDGTLYNRRALVMRNSKMAAYADALALFPGSYGTLDMKNKAKGRGLAIYDMVANTFTPSTKREPAGITAK